MARLDIPMPLWIAVGAALGGVFRYWCSGLLARLVGETFPWGTIFVNVSGSLLIGFIAEVTGPEGRILIGSAQRQFLMTGVLGGYTTFSSWSLQTLNLVRDGEWVHAGGNIVLSVLLCLVGVWLGSVAGAAINR
jgi:CrcB protein